MRLRSIAAAALAGGIAPCVAPLAAHASVAQRVLEIRPLASGLPSPGSLTATLSYRGSRAVLTATTGALALPGGVRVLVELCAAAHRYGRAPTSHCVWQDTAGAGAPAPLAAEVQLERPSRHGRAVGWADLEVLRWSDAGWSTPIATSWPAHGFRDAELPITAPGQGARALPPQEVALPGIPAGRTGGINSFQPGSTCTSEIPPLGPASAPPAGVSIPADGGDYAELGAPTVPGPPRGTIMLLHGGGWFGVGSATVASLRTEADRWRALGWRTVDVDYRACGQSVPDALASFDRLMPRTGRVCLYGESAGALLALDIAARRPVSCVVAVGAPADLEELRTGRTIGADSVFPTWIYNDAVAAFGRENLRRVSPIDQVRSIRAPVLLASAVRDTLIPWAGELAMAAALRAAHPRATVVLDRLPAGPATFVHSDVDPDALQRLDALEARFAGAAPPV